MGLLRRGSGTQCNKARWVTHKGVNRALYYCFSPFGVLHESIFVPVSPRKPRLAGCETAERNVLPPLFQVAMYESPVHISVSSLSSYLHGTESSLGNNGKYIVTYLLKARTVEPKK
jgi:hypothetical protein